MESKVPLTEWTITKLVSLTVDGAIGSSNVALIQQKSSTVLPSVGLSSPALTTGGVESDGGGGESPTPPPQLTKTRDDRTNNIKDLRFFI